MICARILSLLEEYDRGETSEEQIYETIEREGLSCELPRIELSLDVILNLAKEITAIANSTILDDGKIELAWFTAGYDEKNFPEKLACSLALLHPLSDGNKRLSVLAYLYALAAQGKRYVNSDELKEIVRKIIGCAKG